MKKKKILIILSGGVGIIIILGALFFVKIQMPSQKEEPKAEIQASPTIQEDLVLWEDPAGFSFQYPKEIVINKHDEDTENYAHLELTNPSHKGRSIVWVKDTTATTIDQWLKNETSLKGQASVDTTIGGNVAKKILIKEPAKKQITATLDEDVLVMVETELIDESYWQHVNDQILGTLSFSTSKNTTASSGDASAGEESAPADEVVSVE